jgi:dihydroorotase
MKLCIKDGRIIDPVNNFDGIGTIWIEDDVIVCVETEKFVSGEIPAWVGSHVRMESKNSKLEYDDDIKAKVLRFADRADAYLGGYKTIDAKGKWVVPGFVDLHVHFREPGFEYKEDIESGSYAAIKGGFTKVCCMPNTKPTVDCEEVVSYINKKANKIRGIDVFVVGAVTKGQEGKELADFSGMVKQGICAISEDGKTVMDVDLMREAMVKAKELGIPFFSHADDEYFNGQPMGEDVIVERDILLAKETGCKLHFCHVSTKGSVELIRKAKAEGIDVTAEVAPHHFALDETHVNNDGNKKMNPPLRAKDDVMATIKGLADGTIDAIATDHAPHSKDEKEVAFEKAPNGVIGLETSFAMSYTILVKTGILTPMELIEKMSIKPAEILGIEPLSIEAGKPPDIVIADVEEEYEIRSEDFVSKSVNSAFIGMKVFGKVTMNCYWLSKQDETHAFDGAGFAFALTEMFF